MRSPTACSCVRIWKNFWTYRRVRTKSFAMTLQAFYGAGKRHCVLRKRQEVEGENDG
jgi:hypothetical protein